MSLRRRLSPTNDLVFKLLFTRSNSAAALRSIVTAVLKPKVPIQSIEVLNGELPGREPVSVTGRDKSRPYPPHPGAL